MIRIAIRYGCTTAWAAVQLLVSWKLLCRRQYVRPKDHFCTSRVFPPIPLNSLSVSVVLDKVAVDTLKPAPGSRHRHKRKGRGIAAGQGASCGFGMRGQKSRSGPGVRAGFEGGQTALYRRIPKLVGRPMGPGHTKKVSDARYLRGKQLVAAVVFR